MYSEERDLQIAWEKSAKGRGNRWRMLRDIVALVAVAPMTLQEIQDAMLSLKGLSRGKIVDMLDELARPGFIKVTSWSLDNRTYQGWIASKKGVAFWIKNADDIPASIAMVAQTISYAEKSGER
jgi:hypothetical protein